MINIKLKYLIILLFLILVIQSCDKEVSVTPPEDINYESGSVFIDSNPSGAEIIVDGKLSGYFTPDTVKWLSEGIHSFILRTEFFQDFEFAIETKNNLTNDFYYDYYSDPINFGSIKITSNPPGSSIYFNNSLLPNITTPYVIQSLLPNEYKIKLSYPEYRSDSSIVKVFGSQQSVINVTLIDTSIWINYNTDNSKIKDNTIYDVFVDEDDLIWMATRIGIVQLKGKKWNYYNYGNSPLTHQIVHKIRKDRNNAYWIATLNGLNKIENDVWTTYTTTNSSIPGNYISDFDFDNLGNMWIATDAGLVKVTNNDWKIYNTSNSGLPGNFIKAVSIDQTDNSIWVGTNAFGIAHFDGLNAWTYFIQEPPPDTSLINNGSVKNDAINSVLDERYVMGNSISAIAVDKDGVVWAGFPPSDSKGVIGGVQKYSGSEWETIDFGLYSPFVKNIYVSEENIVYISTNNGLVSFKNSYINILRELNSGLHSDDIRAAFPDKNGNLWIATGNTGLVKYKNYLSN